MALRQTESVQHCRGTYAAESSAICSMGTEIVSANGLRNWRKYEYHHRRRSFRLRSGTAGIQGVHRWPTNTRASVLKTPVKRR